jgi:hypothetical protein
MKDIGMIKNIIIVNQYYYYCESILLLIGINLLKD